MNETDEAPRWELPPLDGAAASAAARRQEALTKPRGSLGALEDIPLFLAAIQGTSRPSARPAAAVVFAADHPVVRHGVSAYPAAVTAAMLRNFAAGGAAAAVLARAHGMPLRVIDVGVGVDGAGDAGDLRVEDAMTRQGFARALAAGAAAVDALADTRVLLLGDMGIGNTTAAAAVAAGILGGPPEELVGRGTGLDDAGVALKAQVVSEAVARLGGDRHPMTVLRRVGGRELAALAGAMGRAAERRIAVLVDGFVVTAAALAAVAHEPRLRPFLLFAHRGEERGHGRVLDALGARPLLDLGMRLGEASGALLAWPLVDLACRLHAEMATFAEAAVPDRGP